MTDHGKAMSVDEAEATIMALAPPGSKDLQEDLRAILEAVRQGKCLNCQAIKHCPVGGCNHWVTEGDARHD